MKQRLFLDVYKTLLLAVVVVMVVAVGWRVNRKKCENCEKIVKMPNKELMAKVDLSMASGHSRRFESLFSRKNRYCPYT